MKAKNDKEWHIIVCERDGFVCHKCYKYFGYDYYFDENGVNQYVCGHHLKTKKSHPELRLETDNGKCACDKCHKKIHNGSLTQ